MQDPDHDEYDETRALPWDHPEVLHLRGLTPDQRRMGFDRNTEEGALLNFSGSLSGAKPFHRAVAWVLLVAFSFPVLSALWRLFGDLMRGLAS